MQISLSSQTTLQNTANFFAFSLADASAPTSILEVITPAKPYGNPLQITFLHNCISGHIYEIKLWESADGSATGVVRNSWSQAVNQYNVMIRDTEYLQVGVTAGLTVGATTYTDTSWAGWNYVVLARNKSFVPDFTSNIDPDYHQVATGGFSLIRTGDRFYDKEEFTIIFEAQSSAASTGSGAFNSGRVITTDETLGPSDVNQALFITGATDKITLDLPNEDTIPDYSFLYFFSVGGNHINARLRTVNAAKIMYPTALTEVSIGQAENLVLFLYNKNYYLFQDQPGIKQVGEFFYNYGQSPLNAVLCNGQALDRQKYPRLWTFVQSLGTGVIVSDSVWNSFTTVDGENIYANKRRFSTGNGTTTFRLPLLTNIMLKGTDSTPAFFENHMSVAHEHSTFGGETGGSAAGNNDSNGGTITAGTNHPHVTGAMAQVGGGAITLKGTEVRVKSALAYCFIRI